MKILRRKTNSAIFRARQLLGLGTLPNALIIGAAKCGTTSLFEYLAQHPNACAARAKELRFFDQQWNPARVRWYQAHFSASSRHLVSFEATPGYLLHPDAPARVRSLLPGGKMIVMLREPVARAYSYWNHRRDEGTEPLSFEAAIELEGERKRAFWYVNGGLYAEQIGRWLGHFPPSAFLFIKSEDFYRSPSAELARVTDHLGLPRHRFRDLTPRNQRAYPTSLDPATRARLEPRFADSNARVAVLTGIAWP
ncbi:MAG TPA: sulfotransferase domain-containing protein [Longimicrobium sp.]|nr:sulfotransferase domain-containing protein [Longimicrobium sp.]